MTGPLRTYFHTKLKLASFVKDQVFVLLVHSQNNPEAPSSQALTEDSAIFTFGFLMETELSGWSVVIYNLTFSLFVNKGIVLKLSFVF